RQKHAMSVNTAVVLPLLGRIAAGQPIEAMQTSETISLADFVRSKEVFVLEVRGESMQDEHILDGDYVLVEKSKTAHNGDIVVALVDTTDATLKRFYREGVNIRLQPSNVNMKPIIVPAASVEVQGRVIGVLRKYEQFSVLSLEGSPPQKRWKSTSSAISTATGWPSFSAGLKRQDCV